MPYSPYKIVSFIITLMLAGPFFSGISTTGLTPGISMAQVSDTARDTTSWQPPRFSDRESERLQMVAKGVAGQGVSDPEVLEALRHVPRHLFVPEPYREFAYQNRPLPIGHDQTISQPYIVGLMTQMLELNPGDKVLEIGTGSGYQAAVLSELTRHVFTIEIVEDLGKRAKNLFEQLGYTAIRATIGDGYGGWPDHAPFDAVLLTAAPETIPEPLIEQLGPGGILVAPVGASGEIQMLTKVTKNRDGDVETEQTLPVRFVPLTREADR